MIEDTPHFHAEYGDYRITVDLKNGIIEGKFPKRALRAVSEWYDMYKESLLHDWELAEKHMPLNQIPPLE
ncbi:MAG: DUF4160 domain-containing protein [Deltaproteobacteria bacterium]|nr:DUF4160 domain-containing protein [Deltaproteobacteria bacterium]